jgi:hypothetical protein
VLPLALALSLLPPSSALSLSLESEVTPYSGVTWRQYRTSDPSADVSVFLVDLCTDYVHIDATRADDAGRSTGSWGELRGVQAAVNGDFYTSGPTVYGDAVGGGVPWPLDQTGRDPAYSSEWYYDHYGWIAFGPDWVEFTHTGWVKSRADDLGLAYGWRTEEDLPEPPEDTLALVSGFPELVIEGAQYTCSSPTASDCFPDRSDMRDRHPRSAMGITADRETFILAVVDGRTSSSAGMYGAELADLMFQLGAWEAFNIDGGGSSQAWLADRGYVNNYSGNNSGGGARSVANHWGVFAGSGSGAPRRPGHCASEPACQLLPPEGGVVDDEGDCFEAFGDPDYWREESAGYGGHLYWTNAFESEQTENWAWWRLHLEQAGSYRVEVYREPEFSVYGASRWRVYADGVGSDVTLAAPSGEGWQSLGDFAFSAGGSQYVAVYDNYSADVSSDQHIAADAVRLTRLDGWCGDGVCEEGCEDCPEDCGGCDTDVPVDSAPPDSDAPGVDSEAGGGWRGQDQGGSADSDARAVWERVPMEGGCSHGPGWGGLWGALLVIRRRR